MGVQFQPPPTYADPVVYDDKTRKQQFNPIWLKWFLDVSQYISANGGGGKIQHNSLGGLQGGLAASSEFYHLTNNAYTILKNIASPTAGSVAYGTGSEIAFTAAGSAGQVLTSAGAGVPVWTSLSGTAVTSFSGGTTGLTPSTPTTGAIVLSGILNVANGGTGSATAAGAPFALKGANSDITSLSGLTGAIQTPTWVDFATGATVTAQQGRLYWDGFSTLNLGLTANVTGQILQTSYFYVKASSAITKGQLCMFTGVVGASSVITAAPATGVTVPQYIVGIAAESIALNGFGMIQNFGTLKGFDTTGSSVGETWVNGDVLYYNSSYAGGMTKTFPASGPIVIVAAVVNAGSGGSGSVIIRPTVTQRITGTSPVTSTQSSTGTTISLATGYGDTQNPYASKTANYVLAAPNGSAGVPTFRALVAADIPALPYGTGTVTSVSVVSANGFAGSVATATTTPAITLSTSISGLIYGNGTAIAAATVSAPLTYSAGTLAITQATTSTNGYLSSTDWNTFNNKGSGTVTSVTGTSPVVSSGGTTPAISLASGYGDTQNPYASKTANYVLAAPNGSAGVPTFRALVAADVPALPYQPTAAPVTYTANFSVATTDVWIINNKSGSSCTATLPAASSFTGRTLYFINYQAQTLVSASSNVVPLVGGAAGTAILNAVAGDTCTLVSNGTNWVMTQYTPNNVLLLE